MAKHANGWSAKIVAAVVAPILLLVGFDSWVGANAQRTDTDTVYPWSAAHDVGYNMPDRSLWGSDVPHEVGSALTALVGSAPIGTAVTSGAVIADHAIVRGDGGALGVQSSSSTIGDNGVMSVPGLGTGGVTAYDAKIGGTTTPSYGLIRTGHAAFGITSHNAAAVDLDGAFLIRNFGGPVTGKIEFIVTESTGNTCRFALPSSGVGNGAYFPRAVGIAGPAPADTDFVTVAYWQAQGIFHNLVWDTVGSGAELGVQGNVEFEETLFVDTITESTTAAGVTIESVLLKDGEVDGKNVGDLLAFFNGTFIESFNALVTSDGAIVTMTIEQAGGGDLTMNFSDGQTTLDCTPLGEASIPLTVGSDTSPTDNFIYVLQSSKALTKSTSDWPSTEHIKVGFFLVPSAGFVQTNGVYINHNTNDHAQGTNGQGHLVHITERLRADHAIYRSGGDLTVTIGGGGTMVDVAVTAGVVRQMHKHATPALDTATGDAILILNQNGAAFDPVTDLETLTNDANGVAVKKYFNWLIAAVANKGGEYSPLVLNLPTGSYNQEQSAETDVNGYDVFTLPSEYDIESATGFLIARVTMSKIGGTWAHVSTVDLRGTNPQSAVGGVGGVTTEFADNAFKVFDESDNTKILNFQLSAITTGNTRTITAPDADLNLGLAVTAASASGAANTVVVSAGTDRTVKDAAASSIFGHGALASNVVIQCENDTGAGALSWTRATPHWSFVGGVELTGHIVDGSANTLVRFGTTIKSELPLKILEAAAAVSDDLGYGQLWVKDDAPNTLWFTNDIGTDLQLGVGGGGAPHAILDGSTHSDSVAAAVTRGSLIYGNATPKWDELVIGGAGEYLRTDGTDAAWTALSIVDDTSPQLGGVLDTQGNALNAQSGQIKFEHGGSPIAQFDVNDNFCINATVSPGTTNKNLYVFNTGGSSVIYLTSESDTAAQGPANSYRRRRIAGSGNVQANDRLSGFSFYGQVAGSDTLVGQFRFTMASTTASMMQVFTGTNDLTLTVESTGDLSMEVSGSQINFGGGTTNYIQDNVGGGLIFNAQTGGSNAFYVNGVGEASISANKMAFATAPNAGSIQWGTANQLDFHGSTGATPVISLDGTGLSLYGGTPVAQAAAMTVGLANITHTAPVTPDYLLQDLVDSSAGANFGFATKDEGNTLLAVVKRLQIEVAELRAIVGATAGVGLAAH